MTISEKLDAIKLLLGVKAAEMPAPAVTETPEAEYSQATATDGMIVKWEGELETGKDVILITPEGDKPVPDGSIEFEDGTIITVSGGKITAITEATMTPTEPTLAEQMAAIIEPLKAEIETLKTALAAHETKANETTEQLHKLQEVQNKTVELVEEINRTPETTTPVVVPAAFAKVDKTDRVKQIAEALKAIRNK